MRKTPTKTVSWAATLCIALIFSIILSAIPVNAATDYTLIRKYDTYDTYTLGDIALAKLTAYGILDEEWATPSKAADEAISRLDAVSLLYCTFGNREIDELPSPFLDVPEEYHDAVNWAYQNGLTFGVSATKFGTSSISESEFLLMLLRYLGYDGIDLDNVIQYAESVGLAPLGLSNEFTFANAALYLLNAINLVADCNGTTAKDVVGISEIEQRLFPYCIRLSPHSLDEANLLLAEAINYCADIRVSGEYLTDEELLTLYLDYLTLAYQIKTDTCTETPWYINALSESIVQHETLDPISTITKEEKWASENWDAYETWLETEFKSNSEITTFIEQNYQLAIAESNFFGVGDEIEFQPKYNMEWLVACDIDDVFTAFEDDSFCEVANTFFLESVVPYLNKSDYDIVMAAKRAIIRNASYNYAALTVADLTAPEYKNFVDAHSFVGFFENGRIVCDGYASIFRYLMIRAGIPCVQVYGSTISSKGTTGDDVNHVWNKVMVDGTWYNIDICWADTGWPTTFDLKSDIFFQRHKHWASDYTEDIFASATDYKK